MYGRQKLWDDASYNALPGRSVAATLVRIYEVGRGGAAMGYRL